MSSMYLVLAVAALWLVAASHANPTESGRTPPVPVGTKVAGCCGDTDSHKGSNPCGKYPSGEFDEKQLKIKSLEDCVAACKHASCTQCDFVSWNPDNQGSEDCSWYKECDFNHMLPIEGYTSVKVKPVLPPPPPPPPVQITVTALRGATRTRNVSTVATIEVDVMPFLGRKSNGKTGGGPHDKAFYWLSQLGADLVRFAPWFPNPKLVVAELHPPDCSRNYSSWDPSLLDEIYSDFAQAVGNHTVAMQLSTLPSWMFTDGMNISDCPKDPWEPCMNYGRQGGHLRDQSCGEVARYIARLVSWFTQGGARDECGNWHHSGNHHTWAVLSVLNEVQHEHFGPHNMGKSGPAYGVDAAKVYTTCFDAIVRESRKVYPTLQFVGPAPEHSTQFIGYFLDPKNHADKKAPQWVSFHYPSGKLCGAPKVRDDSSEYFQKLDCWLTGGVAEVEKIRQQVAPDTGLFCNEIYDGDGSPMASASSNLAASWFGYAVGSMAEIGFMDVGQDQLVGGPSPDNEGVVSMLDWHTGKPNAKYYSVQMLAAAFGTGTRGVVGVEKALYPSTNTSAIYVLPYTRVDDGGARRLIICSKLNRPMNLTIAGGWCETGNARVLEAAAGTTSPGFDPPVDRTVNSGNIELGAWALATVDCGH